MFGDGMERLSSRFGGAISGTILRIGIGSLAFVVAATLLASGAIFKEPRAVFAGFVEQASAPFDFWDSEEAELVALQFSNRNLTVSGPASLVRDGDIVLSEGSDQHVGVANVHGVIGTYTLVLDSDPGERVSIEIEVPENGIISERIVDICTKGTFASSAATSGTCAQTDVPGISGTSTNKSTGWTVGTDVSDSKITIYFGSDAVVNDGEYHTFKWDEPQTISVRANDNKYDTDDLLTPLFHKFAAQDRSHGYDGGTDGLIGSNVVSDQFVVITVTDDDTAGITFNRETLMLTEEPQ